ncbi:MAG: HBL/NHE enterotoxin family protein [Rhodopila sp.]|nr:HBL/NHE enterotoxin family protein [Rhodopila sp.]
MGKVSADIINLADVANNPLRATGLKSDLTDTVSSLVLLQIYAAQAAQQPALDSLAIGVDGKDLLPLLAAHQETARRDAQSMLASVSPAVTAALTDILGYGAMLDSFTDSILPLLPSITTSDAARQQVLTLIGQLEIAAAAREGNVRRLATLLSQTVAQARTDSENFAADLDQANKVIGSSTGVLAQIQSQIDDTRRAINAEIAGVVVSALITVGGGVLIGVGALATLPAGVTGTTVVLAGIGVLVTGVGGLAASAAALGTDNDKLAGLYQESARLSMTLTLMRAVAGNIKSYCDSVSGMASAVGSLTSEWTAIQAGIAAFRDDVVRASDASDVTHLATALQLARQDWKSVIGQAQQLMTRLVDLAPQDVKNVLSLAA